MDILREFRTRPPREDLDSLEAVVRDWKWRVGDAYLVRDGVVQWTAQADTWYEAVHRAVFSRDRNGKMHNHQSKVPPQVKIGFFRSILAGGYFDRGDLDDSFDILHDWISDRRVPGIGPVTVYDVAVRIGAWTGDSPRSLYLHAGVREGWRALGMQGHPKQIRVAPENWPEPLRELPADEVEDLLCTYRSILGGLD